MSPQFLTMEQEFELRGNKDRLVVSKGYVSYEFDRKIPSGNGILWGIRIDQCTTEDDDVPQIHTNLYHRMLTHASENLVTMTAKHLGKHLVGTFRECAACALSKITQTKIPKYTENKATDIYERLCLDTSSIRYRNAGGAKYWLLIVDEFSNYKISKFMNRKSHLAVTCLEIIRELETRTGKKVKYIRCDNAGENISLDRSLLREGYDIRFEYTASGTPQQNGKVERAFPTLYGRIRACFNYQRINGALRESLWAECIRTCTYVENILIYPDQLKSSYETMWGHLPNYANYL